MRGKKGKKIRMSGKKIFIFWESSKRGGGEKRKGCMWKSLRVVDLKNW